MLPPSQRNKDNVIINLCKREDLLYTKILHRFVNLDIDEVLHYPVLILCEDLESAGKIFSVLGARKNIYKDRKKIIILKNKDLVSRDIMWQLISDGIDDIIDWGCEEDILHYIESLKERNDKINAVLNSPTVKKNLIGESKIWKSFLYQVIEAALFTKSPLLLTGESGTGKELISRLIHTVDTRPGKRELVLLDCSTIVPELSGSEFFGHERGSYTNAVQGREGAFSLANNGTLFLDEIGELPLNLQAELLRVVQEGTFKKIGSNSWQKTDFRLVSATNRDIKTICDKGGFRQDLYFRISDFEFKVPTLNERKEDIPLLAAYFLKDSFGNGKVPELDDMVLQYLMNCTYKGNIRELKQLMKRIALKHLDHKRITIGEIPTQDRPQKYSSQKPKPGFEGLLRNAILSGSTLRDLKNQTMEEAIKVTLELCNGDKTMAAKKLGVTLRAFQQFWKKNKVS